MAEKIEVLDLLNREYYSSNNTIVVQNFPPEMLLDEVVNNIEVVTKASVKSVCAISGLGQTNILVAVLDDEIRDLSQLQDTHFEGWNIKFEYLDDVKGILVLNVGKISKEMLELYFGSTIRDDGTKVSNQGIKIYRIQRTKCAVILFDDVEAIKGILSRLEDQIGAPSFVIEPYFPKFHDYLLEHLKDTKQRKKDKDFGEERPTISIPITTNFELQTTSMLPYKEYENQLPDGNLKMKDAFLSRDIGDRLQDLTESETQLTPQYDDSERSATINTQSGFPRMRRRQMGILYQGGKSEEEAFVEAMKLSLAESSLQETREQPEDSDTPVDEDIAQALRESLLGSVEEIPSYHNREARTQERQDIGQACMGSLVETAAQERQDIGQAMMESLMDSGEKESPRYYNREAKIQERQDIEQAMMESLMDSGEKESPRYYNREAKIQERQDIEQAMMESLMDTGEKESPRYYNREAKIQERQDIDQAMMEPLMDSGEKESPRYYNREAKIQERQDIGQAMMESLMDSGQKESPRYYNREAKIQERQDIGQAFMESWIESRMQEIPKYSKNKAIEQERKDIEQAMMESLVECGEKENRQPGRDSYTCGDETKMENEIMVGQTRVVLKQGSITRQEADALVNIVDPSGEFPGRSVVGKAFAKNGGLELIQNYQAKTKMIEIDGGVANSDNIPTQHMIRNATTYKYLTITKSAGNLLCEDVIHVKLVRNKPQILQDVMREIYQACSTNGYGVICLPPLGIGQMYSYPVEEVASCMLKATCSSLREGKIQLQEVRFVIVESDPETYKTFDSMLDDVQDQFHVSRSQKKKMTRSKSLSSQQSGRPNFKPEQNFPPNLFNSGTNHHQEQRNRPHRIDHVPNSRRPISANGPRTRGRSLESETRHADEITLNNTIKAFRQDKERQDRTRSRSLDRCQSEKPHNKYSDDHGHTAKAKKEQKLRKDKESAHRAKRDTQQVVSDDKSHVTHTQRKRQRVGMKRGTPEFAKLMATYEAEVPEYWKHFQPGEILKNIIVNIKNFLIKQKHAKVELNNHCSTYKAIVRFINDTFKAGIKHIGQGNDANGIQPYRQFFVVKIHRIENPELFTAYTTKRAEIFSKLCMKNLGYFPKLEKVGAGKMLCQPIQSVCLCENRELGEDLYQEVNEYYFLHGTKPDVIEKICSDGLDNRLCSSDGMLGQGIYGAESVVKADQYTDNKDNRKGGQKKMFLMRMLLGNVFVCTADNPHKYRLAPCTKCYRDDCIDVRHKNHFDSVVGGIVNKRFREFVVYDGKQCYPEYLITYERR